MSYTAFLFPGQGAQTVGMGKELAEQLPAARQLYDRAADLLGYDLAEICFSGPADKLDSTVHSQPALFVTSLAALELLKQQQPDVVDRCRAAAGLSLGEYTAMVFAGVMDFETGLGVVRIRGQAMQDASDRRSSGMVSILGLGVDTIQALCEEVRRDGEILQIANYLCPGNIAVSGDTDACRRIAQRATEAGAIKVVPLAVAGAFHTPIMEPAVARLAAALSEAPLSVPRIPVVSNVDAESHRDPEELRHLLIQQVVSPVRWEDSVRRLMVEQSCDTFYEVGPGRVLRGLLKRINRKATAHGVIG